VEHDAQTTSAAATAEAPSGPPLTVVVSIIDTPERSRRLATSEMVPAARAASSGRGASALRPAIGPS
jgi:hypothetical protein